MTDKYILILDTAGAQCQVCLADADGNCLASESIPDAKIKHSSILLPMINKLLSSCNLDIKNIFSIAYTSGPGSFTGVRIGCSVAKGLAIGVGCNLLEICSLESIALSFALLQNNLPESSYVLVVNDARKQQVYANWYQFFSKAIIPVSDYQVTEPANIKPIFPFNPENKIYIVGSGLEIYTDQIRFANAEIFSNITIASVDALCIYASRELAAGNICNPSEANLRYLRAAVD